MHNLKLFLIACVFFPFFFVVSCTDKEEWTSSIHELKISTASKTAMVGKDFEVTDLSLGVAQRKWTFDGGIPATSADPEVVVVFNDKGLKNCMLEIVYDNGTTESREFTIDVLEVLSADIAVEGLSAMGTIPLDSDVQFTPGALGGPTQFEWTFPGGSPQTSTEESPKVKWMKRGRTKVRLEILRGTDSARFVQEREILVGNYPLLQPYVKAEMDSWSFDAGTKIGKWTAWSEQGRDEVLSGKLVRASGGADGTANALRIDYNKANESWSLFTRDNWTNNAQLQKGKKYEFIFWIKADADFTLSEVSLLNNLPDWSWNELLQAHSKNNWSQYFPNISFTVQNETVLLRETGLPVTRAWKQFRYVFTVGNADIQNNPLPDDLLNTFPSFTVNSAAPGVVYLDEIQINLLED